MKGFPFIITNLCDMNCKFCLRGKNPTSIKLDTFQKILKEIKPLGYDTVLLTGGEAHMHPEFDKLIDMIVKDDFGFTIVSNAKNYMKYAPLLKHKDKFRHITFSLDGGEEAHDNFRGKGSFQKVLEAIRFFSSEVSVRVTMTLNKTNMKEIPNVIAACEEYGADLINISTLIPTGTNDFLVLTDWEKKKMMMIIDKLRTTTDIQLVTLSALSTCGGQNFCAALDMTDIVVNSKGELSFCCDIIGDGAIIGDLNTETLDNLLEKCVRVSIFLKKKRFECIRDKKFFEGFDNCTFCNKMLSSMKNKE
jgi:MoaA/NifB/PqqE/SkfB family radical SAM enzyme